MDRLIATNSVPFASADTGPVTGTPQYATSGNPGTGTPATVFPAYAWNAIQDEIYNVIIAAGLTPNRNTWNQLLTAIQTMLQVGATNVGVDTGAANAYVVAFTPALSTPVPWAPFWFEVKTTNTGASTLNATGTVEPLVGAAHLALQGGELLAKGNALVYWNPTLASGAGSYVLLLCSGAPEQIAPATATQHAMTLGQATGRLFGLPLVFLSTAPYNPSSPLITHVLAKVQAGGGGGAGSVATSSSQISVGGPGAAGGYLEIYLPVSAVAGTTVVVGAAGAGGLAGAAGGNGGNSSFGGATAGGGGGGGVSGAGTSEFAGSSANGSATGGNIINLPGAGGALSYGIAATGFPFAFAGVGANSPIGGAGGAGGGAIGYGGGGGGTANTVSQPAVPGHAGFQGIVEIYELT